MQDIITGAMADFDRFFEQNPEKKNTDDCL